MGQSTSLACAGRDLTEALNSVMRPEIPLKRIDLIRDGKRTALERNHLVNHFDINGRDVIHVHDEARPRLALKVALTSTGQLIHLKDHATRAQAAAEGHKLLELLVPRVSDLDFDTDVRLGGGKTFTVRVNSDQCEYLAPIVRRCESVGAIVDLLVEVLGCGAETLNVSIVHHVLGLMYRKEEVLSEAEDVPSENKKIISSYLWGKIMHYQICAEADPLAPFISRIRDKPGNKDQIVREMRARGLAEFDVQRCIECTGGPRRVGPRTDRYLRMVARQAHQRRFDRYVFEETLTETPRAKLQDAALKNASPSGKRPFRKANKVGSLQTIEKSVASIIEEIRVASNDVAGWDLLVGWEPLWITTVQESMHEATRHKVFGNDMGFITNTVYAVELLAKRKTKGEQRPGDTLSDQDIDIIIQCNKALLESLAAQVLQGLMPRDRFEDRYQKICDSIIDLLVSYLLPIAQKEKNKARVVLCLRTQADFMRHLHVWVPSRRRDAHEIEKLYAEAQRVAAQTLPKAHIVAMTVCTNYAVFKAEVGRSFPEAAEVCRRMLRSGEQDEQDAPVLATEMPPSETFNWYQIMHNKVAFESRLVVLRVVFSPADMKEHEKLEEREGDREAPPIVIPDGDEVLHEVLLPEKHDGFHGSDNSNAWADSCLGVRRRTCPGVGPEEKPPPGLTELNEKAATKVEVAATKAVQPQQLVDPPQARAVHRWLRSRPLFRWVEMDEDERQREEQSERSMQVRWVEHWERHADDGQKSPSRGLISMVEQASDQSVVMAAVVQLSPLSLAHAVHPGGTPTWLKGFMEDVAKWPQGPRPDAAQSAEGERKELQLTTTDSMLELAEKIDPAGIMLREFSDGQVQLTPGDTLLSAPRGVKVEAFISDLRQHRVRVPLKLSFLPCLRVSQVKCLAHVPYVDAHQHFVGFREGANLAMLDPSKSLVALAEKWNLAADAQAQAARAGKVLPTRLRNLSARRNPISAGNRGCN